MVVSSARILGKKVAPPYLSDGATHELLNQYEFLEFKRVRQTKRRGIICSDHGRTVREDADDAQVVSLLEDIVHVKLDAPVNRILPELPPVVRHQSTRYNLITLEDVVQIGFTPRGSKSSTNFGW